ncbi:universal stress protein [Thermosulfuriphilus ammonigenes]|uniref:Universal stress protein n=1 Tax=Thermosulfuriphilus ammonigenes TaxID=1936021 RepID=A0A6G7PX85_9BACT|nr:universal stress protein [Thermosulfuriphilus ammonigenes]MBA2849590.1 nucleotide-binding universal stress UspA family protein [Thermosulfuriphilus ammonigenes]QIJ72305.1 universal stress protein [Thermosulfuriphilus ammonigenes]
MAYTHILIPIDGSEPSLEALKQGLSLAKANQAQVTALYVVPRGEEFIEVFTLKSVKEAFYQEGEKVLEKARKIAQEMGVSLNTRITEGRPPEEIVEVAKNLGCDLIVMGSHGHGMLGKLLIGSCTERVLAMAPCPVLVVKK